MRDKELLDWFKSLKFDAMGNVHVILGKQKVGEIIKALSGKDEVTGLYDVNGREIKVGQVVHWTDGGDDLSLEERIKTRWDRIAVVSMAGILPQFSVIDSPSKQYLERYCSHTFSYGNFIYKDTENHLTIVAQSIGEYNEKFKSAGECMKYVLDIAPKKDAA